MAFCLTKVKHIHKNGPDSLRNRARTLDRTLLDLFEVEGSDLLLLVVLLGLGRLCGSLAALLELGLAGLLGPPGFLRNRLVALAAFGRREQVVDNDVHRDRLHLAVTLLDITDRPAKYHDLDAFAGVDRVRSDVAIVDEAGADDPQDELREGRVRLALLRDQGTESYLRLASTVGRLRRLLFLFGGQIDDTDGGERVRRRVDGDRAVRHRSFPRAHRLGHHELGLPAQLLRSPCSRLDSRTGCLAFLLGTPVLCCLLLGDRVVVHGSDGGGNGLQHHVNLLDRFVRLTLAVSWQRYGCGRLSGSQR